MSWCSPARISSHVLRMSRHLSSPSLPPLWLAFAAPFFKVAYAVIISRGIRSWPMLKCSSERCVWAPHSLSLGTLTLPRLSVSVRTPITGASIVVLIAFVLLYEFGVSDSVSGDTREPDTIPPCNPESDHLPFDVSYFAT